MILFVYRALNSFYASLIILLYNKSLINVMWSYLNHNFSQIRRIELYSTFYYFQNEVLF